MYKPEYNNRDSVDYVSMLDIDGFLSDMQDYKDFDYWDIDKLWDLRGEIVLGSLFYSDYGNSYGIPRNVCCDFFDGYVEHCLIVENENGNEHATLEQVYKKYDNKNSLWEYFCGLEYPFGE